ncbi:YesL family protein [Halalkalibacter sp. APA_J-10(15)]|uniref:YesL family protein n=1 Tax=unclassified Halalkalibacter TaxID=2893063 RepID=UPI001FF5B1D1|nr:DUF624 domain-containing protein [Halalkalibacter sp. APA_J-10(15)]MCK0471818.1 DUF624 domain-containing protein [Halalkalibacter sp. APA_J-10(15)]
MNKLMSIFNWIFKMAYLNGLWILFSLVGLVIFGFFPSTIAMLTICKKWLNGEEELPIFKTFMNVLKAEKLRGNLLGWILVSIGAVLYANFLVIQANVESVSIIFIFSFYLIAFLYIVTLTHVFPLYIHYKVPLLIIIKNAFIMSLSNIHFSGGMIISQSAIYYVMFSYPASALFFLGSVQAMIQMWLAVRSFHRIEMKVERLRMKQESNIA